MIEMLLNSMAKKMILNGFFLWLKVEINYIV